MINEIKWNSVQSEWKISGNLICLWEIFLFSKDKKYKKFVLCHSFFQCNIYGKTKRKIRRRSQSRLMKMKFYYTMMAIFHSRVFHSFWVPIFSHFIFPRECCFFCMINENCSERNHRKSMKRINFPGLFFKWNGNFVWRKRKILNT